MNPDYAAKIAEIERKLTEQHDLFSNHTHSTVDASKSFGPKIYTGLVNADGTKGAVFPPGWSSSVSAGVYTVTHDIGHTNYTVTATVFYIVGTGFTYIDTLIVYDPVATTYFKIAGQAGNTPAFYFTVIVP